MGNFIANQIPEKDDNLRNDVDSLRDYIRLMRDELDYRQNKKPPDYDMTVFGIIVKNASGVINTLLASDADKLDELEAEWYYVQLNNNKQIYKLKCEGADFALGTEVRVCIPSGDYSRMYIDFRQGTTKWKKWVRPSHWLPMPDVKDNEVWILTEGEGSISLYFDRSDWGYDTSVTVNDGDIYTNIGDILITYADDGQRWLKLSVDVPENAKFNVNNAYILNVKMLEIIVGKNVGKNNGALWMSRYDGCVHVITPCYNKSESDQIDLGNYTACECLEINDCNDYLCFRANHYSGKTFYVPDKVKAFGGGGVMFPDSPIEYVYGKNVETVGGIIDIGDQEARNLQCIEFPSATRVLESSFAQIHTLSSVILGENVTLERNAFFGCKLVSELKGVKVVHPSETDSVIGHSGISNIDNYEISSVPSYCFDQCFGLKNINNEHITSLGDYAFYWCRWLEDVYLPNCTSIGYQAFVGCYCLKTLTVKQGCIIDSNSGIDTNYTKIIYV